MNNHERLQAAFDMRKTDRLPVMGGWLAWPAHVAALADKNEEDFWQDPESVSFAAYRRLEVDGLIGLWIPARPGEYRGITAEDMMSRQEKVKPTLEDVIKKIDALTDFRQVEKNYKFEASYAAYLHELEKYQSQAGGIAWCPAEWGIVPAFPRDEEHLMMLALYPEKGRRYFMDQPAAARCRARLVARAIKERKIPTGILTGKDVCSQSGPIVSPAYLKETYFPAVKYALEPLLEAGTKLIWHCDGNVKPVLDQILDLGVAGLQGFQSECGIDLKEIVNLRTRNDKPLIILGPLSVTTDLLKTTPEMVKRKVRDAINTCRGKASLILFTSNTVTPDIPLDNIIAMHEAARC